MQTAWDHTVNIIDVSYSLIHRLQFLKHFCVHFKRFLKFKLQRFLHSSSSAKTITRTPAAEGTALVAGGAAHLLQAGCTDV